MAVKEDASMDIEQTDENDDMEGNGTVVVVPTANPYLVSNRAESSGQTTSGTEKDVADLAEALNPVDDQYDPLHNTSVDESDKVYKLELTDSHRCTMEKALAKGYNNMEVKWDNLDSDQIIQLGFPKPLQDYMTEKSVVADVCSKKWLEELLNSRSSQLKSAIETQAVLINSYLVKQKGSRGMLSTKTYIQHMHS